MPSALPCTFPACPQAAHRGQGKGGARHSKALRSPLHHLTPAPALMPAPALSRPCLVPACRLRIEDRARPAPAMSWGKDMMANDLQVPVHDLSRPFTCTDAFSCSVLSLLFLLQAVHRGQGKVSTCCVLGKGRDGERPPDPHALLDLPASQVGVGKLRDSTQKYFFSPVKFA